MSTIPPWRRNFGKQAESREPEWIGPRGYGARHVYDNAPFLLWDEENHKFCNVEAFESKWIEFAYNAIDVQIDDPVTTIVTPKLPHPLPLTVGGMPVSFVPPAREKVPWWPGPVFREPFHDPMPIRFETGYERMRGSVDPLHFRFHPYIQPSNQELELLVTALLGLCNPRAIHIMIRYIKVELHTNDGRIYQPRSLPRTVGGLCTLYDHKDGPTYPRLIVHNPEYSLTREAAIEDTLSDLHISNLNRQLHYHEIPYGAWFSVSGALGGDVRMQAQGLTLEILPDIGESTKPMFKKKIMYRMMTKLDAISQEDILGKTLVEENPSEGRFAGLVQSANADFAFAECLD